MTEFMEDLDIDIMSVIVDDWKPKNGKQAIVKGAKDKQIIIKAIDIKGLLFASVVIAGITDADGQGITNEEVEKSCWNYQTKVMEKGFKLDMNHDGQEIEGVKLVENSVNRISDNYSHDIVIDFHENKELMEKAVNSGIKGVSPKGRAHIVEKGAFEKAFDKITSVFKGTKTDFEKELERSKMWKAFDVFRSNVSKWVYDPVKGYEDEKIVLSKAEYDIQVDEFAEILKSVNLEIINKGVDMTKEEIMAMTDEQLKEFGVCKIVTAPETPKETLEKAEPKEAPETITKAEFDAYKTEQDAKVEDLKTQLIEVAKGRATGKDELILDPESFDSIKKKEMEKLKEGK